MKVKIIRWNGVVEFHEIHGGGNVMGTIGKLIGADTLDAVNLRDGRVMLVDDNGYETEAIDHGATGPGGAFRVELRPTRARKPVNPAATREYHAICRPGTTHEIVGDVAIVNDADFE